MGPLKCLIRAVLHLDPKCLAFVLLVVFTGDCFGAIYQSDERILGAKAVHSGLFQGLRPWMLHSVAGVISFDELSKGTSPESLICLKSKITRPLLGISCTSFLISHSAVLTSSKCLKRHGLNCNNIQLVFDLFSPHSALKISKCHQVDIQGPTAVIKLREALLHRIPFEFERERLCSNPPELVALSYGAGGPLRASGKSRVYKCKNEALLAEIDSSRSSEGAPVINEVSGRVVGMLIPQENDYRYNRSKSCNDLKVCSKGQCRKALVLRPPSE